LGISANSLLPSWKGSSSRYNLPSRHCSEQRQAQARHHAPFGASASVWFGWRPARVQFILCRPHSRAADAARDDDDATAAAYDDATAAADDDATAAADDDATAAADDDATAAADDDATADGDATAHDATIHDATTHDATAYDDATTYGDATAHDDDAATATANATTGSSGLRCT